MPEKSLGRRDFVKLAAGSALAAPALSTRTPAQATGFPPRPARKVCIRPAVGPGDPDPLRGCALGPVLLQRTALAVRYATAQEPRAKLVSCLVAKNQLWAGRAPLVMFVLARRNFRKTGKENRHAPYDAGAAWMALALQARKLGLYAHAWPDSTWRKPTKCWAPPRRSIS